MGGMGMGGDDDDDDDDEFLFVGVFDSGEFKGVVVNVVEKLGDLKDKVVFMVKNVWNKVKGFLFRFSRVEDEDFIDDFIVEEFVCEEFWWYMFNIILWIIFYVILFCFDVLYNERLRVGIVIGIIFVVGIGGI